MKSIQQLIPLSLLFLFISTISYPTNFYVDKNASGQNNGTSWTNAWQSFSAINWNTIQPGDVINISGGNDSTVYYETLNINDAGTTNNYITIRGAIDAGHNGKAIIDAQNTRSNCIVIEQGCGSLVRNWIYVKNLYLRRAADEAFYIHCNVNNLVIDGLDIRENGLEGIKIIGNDDYYLTEGGICAEDIEIKNCTIVSKSNNPYHEDNCVYAQMVAGLKIHDNFIHQQNKQIGVPVGSHEHVDPLQTHVIRDVKIYNNVMVIDSSVLGHGMILGIQSRPGQLDTVIIYNNYIYAGGHLNPGGDPYINGFVLRWYGYVNSVYPLTYVINNTVVTSNGGENTILQEYAGMFYNNIICQLGTNGQNPANFGGTPLDAFTSSWNLDQTYVDKCLNNLMWNEWTDDMTFGGNRFVGSGGNPIGSPSNWAEWTNSSWGGTGINANPLFVNNVRESNGYVIASNSPARNAGGNLQAFIESKGLPWTDINGNPRSSTPTIGAYEYTGGSDSTFSLSVNIINGWNVVSVPGINPNGMDIDTWWQNRNNSSHVFKFDDNYFPVTTTTPGEGYWMKHTGAKIYNTGDEWPFEGIQKAPHNPINATTGWNLIGGYENNVSTAAITTNPPGLIGGPIYKFTGIYQVATTINPGYGFWIKLTGSGQIILPGTLSKENETTDWFPKDWGRLVLTDATGINYTLYAVKGEVDLNQYELPPAPPEGMFDIRFSTGRIAEYLNSAIKTIEMSGVTYPLTVRVENMDIRLQDETGKQISTNLKSGESVVISDGMIDKLLVSSELKPTKYTLEQNYPNPFNPSTVIEFSLPEKVSNVKLSIYNALGEKVAELVNTVLTAGKYQYQWNAENVATGMYIYELRTDKFVSVKKMLLMK